MRRYTKFISLILVFVMLALAFSACDKNPENLTADDTPDNKTTEAQTGTSDSTQFANMNIEDGYTLISAKILTIPASMDGVKSDSPARIAALKNDSGDNALYFDVTTENGEVISSITWKGYYQLYINSNGALMLMRISRSPITEVCTAIFQYYDISNRQASGGDIIETDTLQINPVPDKGRMINFAVGSPRETARYEGVFLDWAFRYTGTVEDEGKDGKTIYLIADSYLEPSSPSVYSDAEKIPAPNFEDKTISDKFEWEYVEKLLDTDK